MLFGCRYMRLSSRRRSLERLSFPAPRAWELATRMKGQVRSEPTGLGLLGHEGIAWHAEKYDVAGGVGLIA